MKSVGEAMAIGRTFQESFQKAMRSLEVDVDGWALPRKWKRLPADKLVYNMRVPNPDRMLTIKQVGGRAGGRAEGGRRAEEQCTCASARQDGFLLFNAPPPHPCTSTGVRGRRHR